MPTRISTPTIESVDEAVSLDVRAFLKKSGGCSGGVAIYTGAEQAMWIANKARKKRELWPATKRVFKPYFPKLDLGKVRFSINSTLVGNWFTKANSVEAMTFGYRIYFDNTDYQISRRGLKLIMHELVHVDQVRRLGGEVEFACAYGKGYLKGGNYRDNPLEVEAYDFVTEHGGSLPNGVKKPK